MMTRQTLKIGVLFAAMAMISLGTSDGVGDSVIDGKRTPISPGEAVAAKAGINQGEADDPLILDLGGNGINLGGQTRTAMLGGGVRTVRWTTPNSDDAFVLVDATSIRLAGYDVADASGAKITGLMLLREGVQVKTPDGRITVITDSWQFLGLLDANRDGSVNASDPSFGHLYAWIDADANGAIGPGEVSSLAKRGVMAIRTQGGAYRLDTYGNLRSDGTFLTTQGAMRLASGVALKPIQ